MALKQTATTQWGLEVPDAYHRVEGVQLTKTNADFFVRSYANADEQIWFKERNYNASYDMTGENPWKQAYLHVKSQPEWDEAEDC